MSFARRVALADRLRWVVGEHKHIAQLNRFICAEPAKAEWRPHRGKYHPRPWELEVQSGIRDLRLPLPVTEGLILSIDDVEKIASVSRVSFDIDGQQLLVLAIGTRSDVRGEGVGAKTLDVTVALLTENKKRLELDCGIWARIHSRNVPSQRLFANRGFELVGPGGETQLDFWLLIE